MKNTLCIFAFLLIAISSYGQSQNTMKTFDPAFVHTVFFWLNNPDNEEDRGKFEASIEKLLGNSKYTKTNFVGTPPQATRDVVDGSFTYALVVTFESAEAQENYQQEEAHLAFIEEAKDLWNKVVVYDSNGISFP